MAKMNRERALKERRDQKQEKREARKLAAAAPPDGRDAGRRGAGSGGRMTDRAGACGRPERSEVESVLFRGPRSSAPSPWRMPAG